LVFDKNANFFAENWEKSPKIVIITSTPGMKKNPQRKYVLFTGIMAHAFVLPQPG
jgi:hypothetical protein